MEPRLLQPLGVVRSLLFGRPTVRRTWRSGANRDRFPALMIGRLPQGWHVFDDVRAGELDTSIDHIVVGPAGAFTLDTKSLTGKVWIGARSVRHNGHPTDFLPKATREASRASRSLTAAVGRPIEVRGVVAILADDWTIKEKPTHVHVGSPRGVRDWLLRLPVTLSPSEVIEIAAAARERATWTAHVPV
jgi:hypothetical protein